MDLTSYSLYIRGLRVLSCLLPSLPCHLWGSMRTSCYFRDILFRLLLVEKCWVQTAYHIGSKAQISVGEVAVAESFTNCIWIGANDLAVLVQC